METALIEILSQTPVALVLGWTMHKLFMPMLQRIDALTRAILAMPILTPENRAEFVRAMQDAESNPPK